MRGMGAYRVHLPPKGLHHMAVSCCAQARTSQRQRRGAPSHGFGAGARRCFGRLPGCFGKSSRAGGPGAEGSSPGGAVGGAQAVALQVGLHALPRVLADLEVPELVVQDVVVALLHGQELAVDAPKALREPGDG